MPDGATFEQFDSGRERMTNERSWRATDAYRTARRAVRRLDRDAVLAAAGGLSLDPMNAVHLLRLEVLAHVAASLPQVADLRLPTVADTRRAVAASRGLLAAGPDPAEQPFARPFVFGKTKAIAPLGLITSIDYDADLLFGIVAELAQMNNEVRQLARQIEAVLAVLGAVATRAELAGVVDPAGSADRVHVPTSARLRRLSDAVCFAPTDLVALIGDDWAQLVDPLVSTSSSDDVDFDGSNGSLSYKPFVFGRGGALIVAVPSMVLAAATRLATQELHRIVPAEASREYTESLWRDVRRSMAFMSIRPLSDTPPNVAIGHELYRVDEEQLLAVTMVATDPFLDGPDDDGRVAIAGAHRDLLERGDGHLAIVVTYHPGDEPGFFGLEAPPAGIRDILLTPSGLGVIARTELGEPQALSEYATASDALRDTVHVFGFDPLDEYAIYKSNDRSYYFTDEGRPTTLMVQSGSALDLRLEAARRSSVDLVEHPLGNDPVTVMPRWSTKRGVFGPLIEAAQPARVVMAEPTRIWVVGTPYALLPPGQEGAANAAIDTIAYWLWELRHDLAPLLARRPKEASPAVVVVYGVERWGDEVDEGSPVRYRLRPDRNEVSIHLGLSFGRVAQSPDNSIERLLVATLLQAFEGLASGPSVSLDEVVDRVAPLGQKKMFLQIDLAANADIGPDNVPAWRSVRDAKVGAVLDVVGSSLRAAGHAAGAAGDTDERRRLLHEAVSTLLSRLEQDITQFDGDGLLEYLLVRNEAVLRHQAEAGFHLPARVACFPEDAVDLFPETRQIARTSIAGRFLIEYVAVRPPHGSRAPSMAAVDDLYAIADVLTTFGYAADLEYFGLADTNARLLPSGRLGVDDSTMKQALTAYGPSFSEEHRDDAADAFSLRWNEPSAAGSDRERYDAAATAEWGFSISDMAEVIAEIVRLGLEADRAVLRIRRDELLDRLSEGSGRPREIVEAVVNEMTLMERGEFANPGTPYEARDTYPWRFNRRLSLLRKPLVARSTSDGLEMLIGCRAAYGCGRYLVGLISTSRLVARSPEMKRLMGQLSRERGHEFNERLADILEIRLSKPVRRNVRKLGSQRIGAPEDLGDVDVLFAAHDSHTIWAVECKALASARTPHELASELMDLIGLPGKRGLVEKHQRRLAWLADHLDELSSELKLTGTGWQLQGAFIVDADLLGPYLRPTPVPVWTVSKLLVEVGGDAVDAGSSEA